MLTRRRLIRDLSCLAVVSQVASESLLARRVNADIPNHSEMVWLDANENPAGPPASAIKAIVEGAAACGRYHFDEFDSLANAIAQSENMDPEQVLFGVGSTEVIDAAIHAFTSSSAPLITAAPSYDVVIELARNLGHKIVQVPLTAAWAFDVHKLAEEATRSGGGLIYLCNPNNPTASLTPTNDIDWLVANLPPHTVLLVDEAGERLQHRFSVRFGENVHIKHDIPLSAGIVGYSARHREPSSEREIPHFEKVFRIAAALASIPNVRAAPDYDELLILTAWQCRAHPRRIVLMVASEECSVYRSARKLHDDQHRPGHA